MSRTVPLADVVRLLYRVHLERDPADVDLLHHERALDDVLTIDMLSHGIAVSPEGQLAQQRRLHRDLLKTNGGDTTTLHIADSRDLFDGFLQVAYQLCLNRLPVPDEVDLWYREYRRGVPYPALLTTIYGSGEATSLRARAQSLAGDVEDGRFVQLLYEVVYGHGARPYDIVTISKALASGVFGRSELLASAFTTAAHERLSVQSAPANDPGKAYLFGQRTMATLSEWRQRRQETREEAQSDRLTGFSRFPFVSRRTPLVSVITSLYKGGKYIEPFLDNLTTQTIFDQCEILVIDANSPDGEQAKAERYLKRFPNIRYERCSQRIGIYEAWNTAIAMSKGLYCTNANLDDCRRSDSFELQASTLEALPFVDVVYQDVLYSFEANLPHAEIAACGLKSKLPIVSRYNLLEFNMPHNAPMWRKALHEQIGMFDARYTSAGDMDFWLRAQKAGKTFWKINEPHVAYYVNPQGLSTRPDTPGAQEANEITRKASRALISENIVTSDAAFAHTLKDLAGVEPSGSDRYTATQRALRAFSSSTRIPRTTGHLNAAHR